MIEQHPSADTITVAALYLFTDLGEGRDAHRDLQEPVQAELDRLQIRGSLLIAHEGINGTIAGSDTAINEVLNYLRTNKLFNGKLEMLQEKRSYTDANPFRRAKVKLKKEIVTMGVPNIDPNSTVGTYVEPEDWNNLIDQPDVALIDTRNDYEVAIGTFTKADGQQATDPNTTSFREFPEYVDKNLDPDTTPRVAMFCTGGIRCEKATAYLKQRGFKDVFHLKGGILNYLERVPESDTRWQGDCFVFDERVSVDHNLDPGDFLMCYACRKPITKADTQHPHYEQGVSCHQCYGSHTQAQIAALRERQHQIALAKQRGESHLG